MRWLAPLLAVAGWLFFAVVAELENEDAGSLLLPWLVGVACIVGMAQAPAGPRRVGAVGLTLVCLVLLWLGGLYFVPAALALLLPTRIRTKSRRG